MEEVWRIDKQADSEKTDGHRVFIEELDAAKKRNIYKAFISEAGTEKKQALLCLK